MTSDASVESQDLPWLADSRTTLFALLVLATVLAIRISLSFLEHPRILSSDGSRSPAGRASSLEWVDVPPRGLKRIWRQVLPIPATDSDRRAFPEMKWLAHFVVPRWWGPEMEGKWPDEGILLPTPPVEANHRDLFLSVSVAGRGPVSRLWIETDRGIRVPLGASEGEGNSLLRHSGISCLWSPETRRLVGNPRKILPPGKSLAGTLRSVWFGQVSPEPSSGEDLEVLSTWIGTLACTKLQWGRLHSEEVDLVSSWIREVRDRLEERPVPQEEEEFGVRLEQVLEVVDALEVMRGQLPDSLARYNGPLLLRPILGPYRDEFYGAPSGLDWKDDGSLRKAIYWVLDPKKTRRGKNAVLAHTNLYLQYRMRANLLDPVSVGGFSYLPLVGPQINSLKKRKPGPLVDAEALSARARQILMALTFSYLGNPQSSPLEETPSGDEHLRKLLWFFESLPSSLVRDRDLAFARRLAKEHGMAQ